MSRRFQIIIYLLLGITAYSQEQYRNNVPCKPMDVLEKMYKVPPGQSAVSGQENWDVTFYDLSFDVDHRYEAIEGKTHIHLKSLVSSLDSIKINLDRSMIVDSVFADGALYHHESDTLTVILDQNFGLGDAIHVAIAYHGNPQVSGLQSFSFDSQNGYPLISTLSEPFGAPTWWPCKDDNRDKADSLQVTIRVDSALTAVSNGLLQSEIDNGDGTKTWVWKHRHPITTYLVSLAITKYEYWRTTYYFADGDSMPLENWVYPLQFNDYNVDRVNRVQDIMPIFDELFGKYPFADEKYGMASFSWGGAMEHQTCSSMGGYGEGIVAHELAHQWWGDMVTCSNFHHIWINEGFATYSEALFDEFMYGKDAYHTRMTELDSDYEGAIYRSDLRVVWSIFDYIVYGKGAWVLHMLRHIMGDEDFFDALALYRETFKYSHASTDDFRGVVESIYGQDLSWFFDQWIYGAGKPQYTWSWTATDLINGHSTVTVDIEQAVDKPALIYKMPIDIRCTGISGEDTTVVVWNDRQMQSIQFALNFHPIQLEFDPENWIHKTVYSSSEITPNDAQPQYFRLEPAYPNPFNGELTIPLEVPDKFAGLLKIHDLSGNLVFSRNLYYPHAGSYHIIWSASDMQHSQLSSGIYLITLSSGPNFRKSTKVTLIK